MRSKYFYNIRIGNAGPAIPAATREIMANLGLPEDFLSSDSSLSDAPHSSTLVTPPATPVRDCHHFRPPIPNKESPATVEPRRLKPPKISPYFPSASAALESCLPFPPIDNLSFGLVQEQLAHDPFRLLIATIFLNRTRGAVALPVLFHVFDQFPTIESMATADPASLVSMIRCLGFQNQRAKKCIGLAQTWLAHPPSKHKRYRKLHYPCKTDGRDVRQEECIDYDDPRVAWEIAHLPGVGAYSLDSWRIFCRDELRGRATDWKGRDAAEGDFIPEWKTVLPQDKELRAYLTWMWLKEGWVWDHRTGQRTPASEKTMQAARLGGIAHEEDGNWILQTSPVKKVANGLTTGSLV